VTDSLQSFARSTAPGQSWKLITSFTFSQQ